MAASRTRRQSSIKRSHRHGYREWKNVLLLQQRGGCVAHSEAPHGAIELRRRLEKVDEQLKRTDEGSGTGPASWEQLCGQYVRRPRGRAWAVVHFTGGAVLGSFPHIAYSALLEQLAEQASVLVIASPFDISTDHAALTEQCDAGLHSALSAVCDADGYDCSRLPVFGVGHSLGSKLQLLSGCSHPGSKQSHVLVSFNNASASDTVGLVERFAKRIAAERASGYTGAGMLGSLADAIPEGVSEAVSSAAKAAGVEFTPWPEQTLQMAQNSFSNMQRRLDLVQLEDDDLDMAQSLALSLQGTSRGVAVGIHSLPGNHLTPVCARLSNYEQGISTGNAELDQQLSMLQGLTLGDENAVNALATLLSSLITAPR